MRKRAILATAIACGVFATSNTAQESGKVDFGRDVQPLLKQQCISCHGPAIHQNGFRLDRRSDAMRGGTMSPGVIRPRNADASLLYLRISGSAFGPQMPPTGVLPPEHIATLKAWIDQGAEWPDALSGETPLPPPDAAAARLMDTLRRGDRRAFKTQLTANTTAVNAKGPEGSTPLMYAVLYAPADDVRLLLERGADPNVKNHAGATALMWAVQDLEKTRLLLDHRADVNARSDDARTALMIASGRYGSAPIVRLLLERGADPSAKAIGLFGPTNAVVEAATVGDAAILKLLLDKAADVQAVAFLPIAMALRAECSACVDLLLPKAPPALLTPAMLFLAPPLGAATSTQWLLDHGADINGRDPQGHTILMLASAVDTLPVDLVKTLIARGADVNAKNNAGRTALDFARDRGNTLVVDRLLEAGAVDRASPSASAATPAPAASVRAAVERALPLLQATDEVFLKKSGCVSCHNNTLTAMTVAAARKGGMRVDDGIARNQLKTIATFVDSWRERALQGLGIPGDADTVSYILLGMAAEGYAPDPATDAMARFLKGQQRADGHWAILAHRPPLESNDIEVTAASMRSLRVYAPHTDRAAYQKSVQLAAAWLVKAQPQNNEDRAFQLLGLAWAGGHRASIQAAARTLVAQQRLDGGWAQLPSLQSDAYATGQALVALNESGAIATSDTRFKKGVQFLLTTQYADGSWLVRTRAIALQPLFDIGFPHGRNSWISAAATNWAALALANAVRSGS